MLPVSETNDSGGGGTPEAKVGTSSWVVKINCQRSPRFRRYMTIIRGMGPGKASQISEKGGLQVREKCVRVRSTRTMGESTKGSA